ncbi:MAG: Hsp20/alpha crystallin family protein [bacterium]
MNFYHTLREMDRIQHDFNRIFGAFYGQPNGCGVAFLPGQTARAYPLINLYEDSDNYHVEALAAGIDPSKFDISIIGNILTLSGEKSHVDDDVKPEAVHRSERAAGKFVRTVELPTEVDTDNISAEYRNGILYIHVPKTEEAKPKSIEVKIA